MRTPDDGAAFRYLYRIAVDDLSHVEDFGRRRFQQSPLVVRDRADAAPEDRRGADPLARAEECAGSEAQRDNRVGRSWPRSVRPGMHTRQTANASARGPGTTPLIRHRCREIAVSWDDS